MLPFSVHVCVCWRVRVLSQGTPILMSLPSKFIVPAAVSLVGCVLPCYNIILFDGVFFIIQLISALGAVTVELSSEASAASVVRLAIATRSLAVINSVTRMGVHVIHRTISRRSTTLPSSNRRTFLRPSRPISRESLRSWMI